MNLKSKTSIFFVAMTFISFAQVSQKQIEKAQKFNEQYLEEPEDLNEIADFRKKNANKVVFTNVSVYNNNSPESISEYNYGDKLYVSVFQEETPQKYFFDILSKNGIKVQKGGGALDTYINGSGGHEDVNFNESIKRSRCMYYLFFDNKLIDSVMSQGMLGTSLFFQQDIVDDGRGYLEELFQKNISKLKDGSIIKIIAKVSPNTKDLDKNTEGYKLLENASLTFEGEISIKINQKDKEAYELKQKGLQKYDLNEYGYPFEVTAPIGLKIVIDKTIYERLRLQSNTYCMDIMKYKTYGEKQTVNQYAEKEKGDAILVGYEIVKTIDNGFYSKYNDVLSFEYLIDYKDEIYEFTKGVCIGNIIKSSTDIDVLINSIQKK